MSGEADTIARYDRAVDRLVRFHPDVVDLATELVDEESPSPMAQALIAYLHLMSTDPADLATARDAHAAARRPAATNASRPTPPPSAPGSRGDWGGAAAHASTTSWCAGRPTCWR